MKKILIIDDDEVFVKTLQDFLPKEKYETVHAKDGVEGLGIIDKDRPNLIILDLLMPRMGGMEFLDDLREKKLEKEKTVKRGFTLPRPLPTRPRPTLPLHPNRLQSLKSASAGFTP